MTENDLSEVVKNNNIEEHLNDDEIIDVDNVEEPKKTNKVVRISATSKVSTQLNDVWYAFSYTEVRDILDDSDMDKEKQELWDSANAQVDMQVDEVIKTLQASPQAIPQQPSTANSPKIPEHLDY